MVHVGPGLQERDPQALLLGAALCLFEHGGRAPGNVVQEPGNGAAAADGPVASVFRRAQNQVGSFVASFECCISPVASPMGAQPIHAVTQGRQGEAGMIGADDEARRGWVRGEQVGDGVLQTFPEIHSHLWLDAELLPLLPKEAQVPEPNSEILHGTRLSRSLKKENHRGAKVHGRLQRVRQAGHVEILRFLTGQLGLQPGFYGLSENDLCKDTQQRDLPGSGFA